MSASGPINVVSLRTRCNARGELLITAMPISNESAPAGRRELLFAQIAGCAGYNTQFVFFSGSAAVHKRKAALLFTNRAISFIER